MHYVYLLQSQTHPTERYTGLTSDLKARLQKHNEGGSPHTSQHRPWNLQTYVAFQTKTQAAAFERYLKSASGRAFANKRLWP
ncbi:MAG: GIY-YIG nuclease family protein [Paludibaculum sp.]